MIIVDGVTFNIPIMSLKRNGQFLDKYAKRTEDGNMNRKLIGVYYNYSLKLGRSTTIGRAAYQKLWDKLTEPVEYHTVTVPDGNGSYTYTAYFGEVSDELMAQKAGENYWRNLTVDFIAKSPARRPA